jgi:hypothetical protein
MSVAPLFGIAEHLQAGCTIRLGPEANFCYGSEAA